MLRVQASRGFEEEHLGIRGAGRFLVWFLGVFLHLKLIWEGKARYPCFPNISLCF